MGRILYWQYLLISIFNRIIILNSYGLKIVMKILKEDIRNRIVTAARNEFIKNGFRKTSMRTISAKSGVVLGNIYKPVGGIKM